MNTLPIARARMRVRVTLPSKDGKRLKDKILALISEVEEDDWSDDWELVCSTTLTDLSGVLISIQTALIEPGSFRLIDEILQSELKGKGKIETLSFAAVTGEAELQKDDYNLSFL